jgi:cytochrome c oxidase subunit II
MSLASRILASSNLGSPGGVTEQDKYVHHLWVITYILSVPIGLIVLGLIFWCVIRYRAKPGSDRQPAQFQYHIPIEAAYTILPLVVVAIVFGYLYNAENKVDHVAKNPSVAITVDGFQWGWDFIYPNGHKQIGTVADELDINSNNDLPVLVLPQNETVQLHVVSLDVVHTFYVKEFLFQRDLIPGVTNIFDLNVTKTGIFQGQCNNICGQYHAYMRFLVDVMPVAQYNQWYSEQQACSITTAGVSQTENPTQTETPPNCGATTAGGAPQS